MTAGATEHDPLVTSCGTKAVYACGSRASLVLSSLVASAPVAAKDAPPGASTALPAEEVAGTVLGVAVGARARRGPAVMPQLGTTWAVTAASALAGPTAAERYMVLESSTSPACVYGRARIPGGVGPALVGFTAVARRARKPLITGTRAAWSPYGCHPVLAPRSRLIPEPAGSLQAPELVTAKGVMGAVTQRSPNGLPARVERAAPLVVVVKHPVLHKAAGGSSDTTS